MCYGNSIIDERTISNFCMVPIAAFVYATFGCVFSRLAARFMYQVEKRKKSGRKSRNIVSHEWPEKSVNCTCNAMWCVIFACSRQVHDVILSVVFLYWITKTEKCVFVPYVHNQEIRKWEEKRQNAEDLVATGTCNVCAFAFFPSLCFVARTSIKSLSRAHHFSTLDLLTHTDKCNKYACFTSEVDVTIYFLPLCNQHHIQYNEFHFCKMLIFSIIQFHVTKRINTSPGLD